MATKNSPVPNGQTSRREQLRARQAAEAKRARTQRIIMVAAGIIALIIVAIVAVSLVQHHGQKNADSVALGEQITPPRATQNNDAITYRDEVSDSVLTARLFADFQCPGCANYERYVVPVLQQLADQGKINLEFHILHGLDRALGTTHSQRAAIAATCADTVDAFSAYAPIVFANQPAREGDGWTDEQLIDFASQASISGDKLTQFTTCFTERQTNDFVDSMQKSMPDYIRATPSLVVNDKVVELTNDDIVSADALLTKLESYR